MMSEWISVKDRLPKKNNPRKQYLVRYLFDKKIHYWVECFGYMKLFKKYGFGAIDEKATHWKEIDPLPEAPKE